MSTSSVSSLISSIAVPLAVVTVFALARKYFPGKATAATSDYTTPMDQLNERFRITQYFVGVAMLLMVVVIGWVGIKILSSVNVSFARAEGPAQIVLLPSSFSWWFLPGFAALTFAWDFVLFLWSHLGNAANARQYDEWSARKTGFDARRILHWMGVIIVLPVGVFTVLAVPMHTTLHENEMRIREYASLSPHRYPYSDAKRLAVVQGYLLRDGSFARRPAVIVDFGDGRRWSSADSRDTSELVDPDLVAFLHQKTGLPVIEADTIEKLP